MVETAILLKDACLAGVNLPFNGTNCLLWGRSSQKFPLNC